MSPFLCVQDKSQNENEILSSPFSIRLIYNVYHVPVFNTLDTFQQKFKTPQIFQK